MFFTLLVPFLQIIMPEGTNEKLLNYEIAGVFIVFLILLVGIFFRANSASQNKLLAIMEKRLHENNAARNKHREAYEKSIGDMQSTIIEQQKEISTLQRQSDMMGAELMSCQVKLSEKIDEITSLNEKLTVQMAEVSKLLTAINTKS